MTVSAIDRPGEGPPWRTLPAPARREVQEWPTPTRTSSVAKLIDVVPFRVRGPGGPYVTQNGRKVLESAPYVFYDQVDDPLPYTAAEYSAMAIKLRANYTRIVRLFGEPTDLDDNERIVVFFGHAVAAEDPERLAYVDLCNLSGQGDCAVEGEIIYVRSLPDMGTTYRDDYALVQVPGAILHETIHLAWFAHGWRRFGRFATRNIIPQRWYESSAQFFAFADDFERDTSWKTVDRVLRSRRGILVSPFVDPYMVGGLLFHWLRQRYGEGFDQALIDECVDYSIADPFEDVTGMPESLASAAMFASLYFDGTPFGSQTGLEFPEDDVHHRIPRGVPALAIATGSTRHDNVGADGSIIYEVLHDGAARVAISTNAAGRAYVLIAQPQ